MTEIHSPHRSASSKYTLKILFISKGKSSASTRYRASQFFSRFADAGIETLHVKASGNLRAYIRTLHVAYSADVVIVLRKTFPAPYLWLLRKASRKLVFDFDDAIFCNTDGTPSKTRMKRFAAMVSVCDHVLAGNQFLANKAALFNKATTIIPTCVDASKYLENQAKPADHIELVWIGSSSTRKYLVEALPALRLAASRVANLHLKIIADFDLPGAGLPVRASLWSSDTEARELGAAHIGIAPMRDDNDWTRGKCALKVLQYMAAGLPVISSNCGANAEIIADRENGFLVSREEDWGDRILELASDPLLREKLGTAGRKTVSTHYDIGPIFQRLLLVITSLSKKNPATG
ncbi:MAG: glycosyltransferase [bacterium]|nr:MAG: glycosyltransferase [bacterium]KAF0148240.1 MAG: glycosyltransferase [bacterium]KAF0167735.1 MAG: glycosyltransferase [bacterium]TXT20136.1 MAG: glycosyltransferase [bacterium]